MKDLIYYIINKLLTFTILHSLPCYLLFPLKIYFNLFTYPFSYCSFLLL